LNGTIGIGAVPSILGSLTFHRENDFDDCFYICLSADTIAFENCPITPKFLRGVLSVKSGFLGGIQYLSVTFARLDAGFDDPREFRAEGPVTFDDPHSGTPGEFAGDALAMRCDPAQHTDNERRVHVGRNIGHNESASHTANAESATPSEQA
jgi:hypothetical protein